eukprot:TRINITY_DN10857_c0_g1_i1.p1 TRINITY_DN10857_c0_g1~~TRINITY_DN10857_c0_g1_i1.p1  ORF type:complete len:395 (-),score=98.90 TRINITY_DN10857_c0_g1_i1:158-1294(-)
MELEQAKAQAALDALAEINDDAALIQVILEILKHKPQICPAIVAATCPDLTYAPSKAITERRAKGTIKTVNPGSGYGFISCPDISAVFGCDVFAHLKQIGNLQPGTEVSFAILLNKDSKPQAFDIDECAGGGCGGKGGGAKGAMMAMMETMMGAMTGKGAGGSVKGAVKGMMGGKNGDVIGEYIGTIKNYNMEKGFGFLDIPALAGSMYGDVYVHQSNIGSFTMNGHQVKCQVYLHNGRAQARNLEDATGMDPNSVSSDAGGGDGGPGGGIAAYMGGGGGGGSGPDQELGTFVGTVKMFNQAKGYGFLTCEALMGRGYGDVFVNAKNIGDFQAGDIVTFTAYLHKGQQLQGKDLSGTPSGRNAAMGGGEPRFKMARFF